MKMTPWIVAFLLGFLAWALLVANITIPIGSLTDSTGSSFFISPAEVPLVLAPALAGPAGVVASTSALLLFLINGAFGRVFATSLTHVIGGIWLAFAYRFIFKRIKMPLRLVAWMGILVGYFMMMMVLFPLLNVEQYHFSPVAIIGFLQVAWFPALAEMLQTIIISSMILFALPEKYRKPLWYEPKSEAT